MNHVQDDHAPHENLEAQVEQLQKIIDAGTLINSTLDLGTVLQQVMTSAKEVMGADASCVMLLEEETGDLVCLTATGPVGDQFKELFRIKKDTASIANWVSQNEAPLLIDDAYSDDRFCPDYDRQTGFKTQSIMAVPLLVRGRLIGVAEVINKRASDSGVVAFDDHDRKLFEAFCNQAAVGIENARLHHRLLQRTLMERDIEFAAQVQQSFLPVRLPCNEQISVFGRCVAALDIGGDMYDIVEKDDGSVLVALGDVSGKGASGALYMASVVSDLRGLALRETDVSKMMHQRNNLVCERVLRGRFITFVLMFFDFERGEMTYAIAGHPPILRVDTEGKVDRLSTEVGIPLGFYRDTPYPSVTVDLRPGDRFLAYTDGFIEAPDISGEFFDIEGLESFMSATALRGEAWVDRLYDRLHAFAAPDAGLDDLTVVLCETGGGKS